MSTESNERPVRRTPLTHTALSTRTQAPPLGGIDHEGVPIFSRLAGTAARRQFGRLALAVAGAHATLVLTAAATVALVVLFADDPGFIGIWLIFAALPLSLPVLWLTETLIPGDGPTGPLALLTFGVPCTAAGLFQSWLLWVVLRGPRR